MQIQPGTYTILTKDCQPTLYRLNPYGGIDKVYDLPKCDPGFYRCHMIHPIIRGGELWLVGMAYQMITIYKITNNGVCYVSAEISILASGKIIPYVVKPPLYSLDGIICNLINTDTQNRLCVTYEGHYYYIHLYDGYIEVSKSYNRDCKNAIGYSDSITSTCYDSVRDTHCIPCITPVDTSTFTAQTISDNVVHVRIDPKFTGESILLSPFNDFHASIYGRTLYLFSMRRNLRIRCHLDKLVITHDNKISQNCRGVMINDIIFAQIGVFRENDCERLYTTYHNAHDDTIYIMQVDEITPEYIQSRFTVSCLFHYMG